MVFLFESFAEHVSLLLCVFIIMLPKVDATEIIQGAIGGMLFYLLSEGSGFTGMRGVTGCF